MFKEKQLQELKQELEKNELLIRLINILATEQKTILKNLQKQLMAQKEKFER